MTAYKGFTEAQAKAHKKYMEGVATIQVRTTADRREIIKTIAGKDGESVNAYINSAIDERIERRCRYRLDKHGMKLHKERNERGEAVYYLTDEINTERPDDDDGYRWLTLSELLEYCEELAEKDSLARAEEAERRAAERA